MIRNARFQTRLAAGGSAHGEADLEVESPQPHRLVLALPAGAELLTCEVAGQRVRPALADSGALEIAVPASKEKPVAVRATYLVRGAAPPDPAGGRLQLGLPATPVFIHQSEWSIGLPAAWEVRGVEGAFEQIEIPPVGADGTRLVLRNRFTRNEAPAAGIHYRARVRPTQ